MTEHQGGGNLVSLRDVYDIVTRIESQVEGRLDHLERKMDAANAASAGRIERIASRMDRLEGGLDLIKWIGPAGVVSVIFGVAKASGVL